MAFVALENRHPHRGRAGQAFASTRSFGRTAPPDIVFHAAALKHVHADGKPNPLNRERIKNNVHRDNATLADAKALANEAKQASL